MKTDTFFLQSVESLSGVGPRAKTALHRLGIQTIRDLFWHLPVRYDQATRLNHIADVPDGVIATVSGELIQLASRRSFQRRGLTMVQGVIRDDSGDLQITWFRQPYVIKQLAVGDMIEITGVVKPGKYGRGMTNPAYKKMKVDTSAVSADEALHDVIPYYPLTAGMTQPVLRKIIRTALANLPKKSDYLPTTIQTEYNLLPLSEALKETHGPSNHLQAIVGQRRLLFDQFFIEQLAVQKLKAANRAHNAPAIPFLQDDVVAFVQTLPFALTDDQRKTTWRIIQDCETTRPMNRLVIGDVGSGKTVVAAIAALNVIRNGYQVALMAPTTILAEQHMKTLQRFFQNTEITMELLTGTPSSRTKTKKALTADIIIGTHALIQKNVRFRRLGLAIVDEQHRFGVGQRKKLMELSMLKNSTPHFLSLSATPIPRTLALTLYGDLDLSLISQMPVGRKPITTRIIGSTATAVVENHIIEHAARGEATFILCPLIEDSDMLDATSVTTYAEQLQTSALKDLRIGVLHGRMKPAEKEAVLQNVLQKKIDILVTTTVVEVGIDIPHATTIVIENAERFGLAQLHQLRGRVGRSDVQSYCFLKTASRGPTAIERLQALETEQRGMKLAEIDLQLRGSGDLYGTRQSGSGYTLEDAMHYPDLVEAANSAAAHTSIPEELQAFVDHAYQALHRE